MDAIKSSYEFHRELESPVSFVRREWQAFVIFGGVFIIVLLIGVFAVDPAYFYPRLSTDPLLYYLKGLAFAETGSTVATTAINRRPFQYVAMPGVMRAPFMMMFSDFDNQFRAIQVSNIALVTLIAAMFAYVLSWVVPRSRHWMAIGFVFGFMLLSPNWVANVFEPLADAPYAVFTLGVILLSTRILTSDKPLRRHLVAIAAGALLFVLAFMVKFTAPVLIVFIAVLAAGRPSEHQLSRRTKAIAWFAGVAGLALLIALNWGPIIHRYLPEPIGFLTRGSKSGMLLNLLGISIPAHIIPVYHLAFDFDPVGHVYRPKFGTTPNDAALTALGVGISLIVVYGVWRARRRFLPEAWYFLAALPVITLMIPSTRRYLLAYEPLIWIFFYAGATALFRPLLVRVRTIRVPPALGLALFIAATLGLIFVRSQRVVGSAGNRSAGISIGQTRGYVNQVSSTFRDLRGFIETLPRDRSLLVGGLGTVGRWKAISHMNYYSLDSTLSVAARTHDIYVLLECGTREGCHDFDRWDSAFRLQIDRYGGPFAYEPVFTRNTEHAKARVYRLTNPQ
ncbi:MAG: hypothetical protein ABIW94_04570 [Gemmatimonadaceae bacterium]